MYKIYSKRIDEDSIKIIKQLYLENPSSTIRIMPDYHLGKGCVIGTTMDINGKVSPSHIGVDIGCGVTTVIFTKEDINLAELDDIIRKNIPSGKNVRDKKDIWFPSTYLTKLFDEKIKETAVKVGANVERVMASIGTLGGGNHFIELGEYDGKYYLTVHSGSRGLGVAVKKYYDKVALKEWSEAVILTRKNIIEKTPKQNISKELKLYDEWLSKNEFLKSYLCKSKQDYLNDVRICVGYAEVNRYMILKSILDCLGVDIEEHEYINSTHNYIDENKILRKGAISSQLNEMVVIPMNMRDGIIVGKGKGNKDWNYSAPHGAGRILSRTQAKETVSLEEFKDSMKEVYTTCINEHTLDESPMAYKPMEEIVEAIKDTVNILYIIKPIYNYKDNK